MHPALRFLYLLTRSCSRVELRLARGTERMVRYVRKEVNVAIEHEMASEAPTLLLI
jgi:hypothetical protein